MWCRLPRRGREGSDLGSDPGRRDGGVVLSANRADGLDRDRAGDVALIAKGGAVQVTGQFVQGIVAFLFVAVVVRLLGTADYGSFRQVAQILAIAAQVGLAGFNYAAMRYIAKARASGDPGAVWSSAQIALAGAALSSGIVFVVLVATASPIAARFADTSAERHDLAALIRLGAGFVPLFALTQVLRYCTQAYKTMVPSVLVGNIVQPLVRLLVATGLIVAGFGVGGAVVAVMIASAVALVVAVVLFRRMLTGAERMERHPVRAGPIARFALLQGGASLFGVQTLGLGVLLLGLFGTDHDVGLLGIALALQTPGTLFLGGVVNIWAPVVTDLFERGEMDRLASLYRTITRWVVTFSLPIFAALIVVPELFLDILVGPRGAAAASLVAVLALGNIFYTGTGPTGFVLSMTGHPGVNLVNSIVAVLLYVGLGVIIVPAHGALGMAAVDAIVTVGVNAVRVIEARILVGIHPFGVSLLKPVLATVLAVVVLAGSVAVLGSGTAARAVGMVMAGLVYVGVLLRLGLDPEEQHVWNGFKRRARVVLTTTRPN